MNSLDRLYYSIASIFAIVSLCAALPIDVASNEHGTEVIIGLLLLTCISITILACTCCHRNKSGFEEFENENTTTEVVSSSSRSEFPIFRPISTSNLISCQQSFSSDHHMDNIVSNIVNQNQMNRTFNEFENNQNNNGPISIVDMENIQNNNAVDYIPNRNEANITIEPPPQTNYNRVDEMARGRAVSNTLTEPSMQMRHSVYDNAASSSYEPYYQMYEFDECRSDDIASNFADTAAASESLNNYIDLDEKDDSKYNSAAYSHDNEPTATDEICSRRDDNGHEPIDDDGISVEEALRALDFAISGGESVFSDYLSDSSCDESEDSANQDEPQYDKAFDDQQTHPSVDPEQHESNCTGLIKTVDAKDNFSIKEGENYDEQSCDASNEHSRDVYEVAKSLVDSVLDECEERIARLMQPVETIDNETIKVPSENCLTTMPVAIDAWPDDLDDSILETFNIGKMEASTPCHKSNVDFQRGKNQLGVNLFPTLAEVNESMLSSDDIQPLQTTQTIACTTFEVQPNEKLSATFVRNDDQTFVANNTECLQETFDVGNGEVKGNEVPRINPIIRVDKDEVNSDDLTTITPMNTPIELNYVGESWDQFVSSSMNKKSVDLTTSSDVQTANTLGPSTSKNAWFLHPQQTNDTFDVNDNDYCNDGTDDETESVEENPELLSLTFDALRKQLAESLPNASVRPSVEYSDDEENGSDSDPECENFEYLKRFENPKSEVIINYKQQLSPIMEESEDETCKTFVMNETKCLDSTSTGCIETSEAIMGVTKVLMASNDTLFNFEDTLGDRDDMLSPRHAPNSDSTTSNSTTPQPDNCKTPTNEALLNVYPIEYKPNDLNIHNDNIRPNSLQLNIENIANNLSDLLSPEQQKTFSEEINTIEQLSSDLSATIDATNTLDDLQTCISVHLNDDTNNIKSEETRPNEIVETFIANGKHSESSDDNVNVTLTTGNGIEEIVAEHQLFDSEKKEVEQTNLNTITNPEVETMSKKSNENSKINKLIELFEPIESVKENKNPNYGFTNVTKPDLKQIYTLENEDTKCDQSHSERNEPAGKLSGEEDPWAAHSLTDIQFSGPRSDNVILKMTDTFTANDWDSDIEDSNSSEEFVYAKGVSEISEYLRSKSDMDYALESRQIGAEFNGAIGKSMEQIESSPEAEEHLDSQTIWNSHEDLIAVTSNADAESTDDVQDESSISENENEWVPSSWDSMAKPMRSALKSPDKSSSDEESSARTGTRSRRNVVFKKQSYQSVYEYPKENVTTSPIVNERQGWATFLANSSPFSSTMADQYITAQSPEELNENKPIDFNALDGFSVSSSSRPFHLSQFSSERHTWPTDSEFSCDKDQADNEFNHAADSHGWAINTDKNSRFSNDELVLPKSPNLVQRPDSGVGESQFSFGDLCHTKSLLRLPLNVYSAALTGEKDTQSVTADDPSELSKSISQNDSENVVASDSMDSIVPTSCTGSMDSINSFDGGKSSQNHLSNSTNADGLLINTTEGRVVSNETSVHNDITINSSKKCDFRTTANRQSDSTDEDSGIENIVRVTKEI